MRRIMAGSEVLKDIGSSLDVTEKDFRDVKKAASKQRLMHIAKLGLPLLSFVFGLLVGMMANSPSTASNSYPFVGAAGVQAAPRTHRRLTWTATLILSVVLYVFGLLLYESMASYDFRGVTLY